MLSIYRRHREKCKYAEDRVSKKCRCPLWATGTLVGEPYRKTLKTRSFERATQLVRDIEDGEIQPDKERVTIEHGFQRFLREADSRNLSPSTVRKYKLVETNLKRYAEACSLTYLDELTSERIRDFRQQRVLGPRTAGKELERIKAFFNFAKEAGWIEQSPAKTFKPPKVKPNPTLPFSDGQVQQILAASNFKQQVFYRTLLHSGLRILDASSLQPERIQDGKLFLYQQKTGQPVWVPLPPDLVADLKKLPLVGGFFFAVESEKPESIAEYYRKKLHKIEAGFHAHRFRDTFATNLLQAGVPLEEVSILLGHSSIRITEEHYAPWISARQTRLEDMVRKTWKPKLALVKKS